MPQVCTPVAPATYDPDKVACKSEGLGELTEVAGPLFIVHTKPRQEKVLAWELARLGYGYFLPMLRVARQSGRKKYIVRDPVFRQYLIVAGDRDVQDAVYGLPSDRVIRTINVEEDEQERFKWELTQVDAALRVNDFVELCPYAVPGKMVLIKTGPYRNLWGKVVRRDAKAEKLSVVLWVQVMGGGVELTVGALDLDPDAEEPAG